jgi:predicted Zn-dependent protease
MSKRNVALRDLSKTVLPGRNETIRAVRGGLASIELGEGRPFDSVFDALQKKLRALETLRGRSQFLFEHGSVEEAEVALQSLIDHDPGDASAHHNLGTLRMRTQRYDGAVEAYRRSLSLRPRYAATHLNLG